MQCRLPGTHDLGRPCPNRITLPTTVEYQLPTPDRMQPSGTTKDVPAIMNRLSGIKTRLNLDPNHAGPMMEKTKTNLEHFCNNLFTIKPGKICGTGNRFIGCVMQGKERSVVRQFTATYKRRHRADLSRE